MLGCLGLRRGSFGSVAAAKAVSQKELDAAATEASAEVESWDGSRIVIVRDLQAAVRNHGQVQLARDAGSDGRLLAVKRMPTAWVRTDAADFAREYPRASEKPWADLAFLRVLQERTYPYACHLRGIFRNESETFVATSFCTEGDLFDWCHSEGLPAPGPEREERVRPVAAQLLAAVRWLHDLGVAHRDLSLENVVLTRHGSGLSLRLIDFGMATLQREVRNEVVGKLLYQAPEVHTRRVVDTFLADAFAVGAMIYSMVAKDYPWTSTQRGKCQLFEYFCRFGLRRLLTKRRVRRGNGEYLIEVLSAEIVEVLDVLLETRPRKRASLGQSVFDNEFRIGRRRSNVWDMPFFFAAEPRPPPPTPPHRPGGVAPPTPCQDHAKFGCRRDSISTCSGVSGGSLPSELLLSDRSALLSSAA